MSLREEFEYYKANQAELVKKHNGKFIVITNKSVVGVYDTEEEAYKDSVEKYKPGEFLIQKVSPGTKDYTATFHSRVIYN